MQSRDVPPVSGADFVLLAKLHSLGSMSRLQLLQRGISRSQISFLLNYGILREAVDVFGIHKYTVSDAFVARFKQ